MYVCLSIRLKKINATGVASVEPGKVREWIGVANYVNEVSPNEDRQLKFHHMKFAK